MQVILIINITLRKGTSGHTTGAQPRSMNKYNIYIPEFVVDQLTSCLIIMETVKTILKLKTLEIAAVNKNQVQNFMFVYNLKNYLYRFFFLINRLYNLSEASVTIGHNNAFQIYLYITRLLKLIIHKITVYQE